MRAVLAICLFTLLALPGAPALDGPSHVQPFTVCSDGAATCAPDALATGLVGIPTGAPAALVVIAHGYGHDSESHRAHLEHLAANGYLAVAMDFRGTGFPLRAGADDTIAATNALVATYATERVVLYSVSMGSAVAGMVLAEMPGVFDQWVNNEGLIMLSETWAGASVLAPANGFATAARDDIEAECGGTPAEAPLCYAERSTLLRAPAFTGLTGVVLTHGLNDGLVPYNQGREMVSALRALGIASDFYTVVRSAPGTEGTTITGYSPLGGQGLAGHGSESDDAHALTGLSFSLLDDVLAGTLVPSNAENVVDSELGSLP